MESCHHHQLYVMFRATKLLINQRRRGLATGICFMGSGLGGMILNPLLGIWLERCGWRMSFRILGVIMAVVAIPCVLLVRIRPEHMGLRQIGRAHV